MIEIEPTAFWTETQTLTLTSDLTFNPIFMIHTHTKGQGQRSLGSKVRVEMDVQTDDRLPQHVSGCVYNVYKVSTNP